MKQKGKKFTSVWVLLLLIFILPCCLLFSGCGTEIFVKSIDYSYTRGDTAVYTVTYSDGKTSTISVNASEISTEDVFLACVNRGLYQNTDEDFKKFISVYFANNVNDSKLNIYRVMNSVVSVYAAFPINNPYRVQDTFEVDTGAGVIFSMGEEYSYIVTNSHVVTNGASLNKHRVPDEIAVWLYGYEPKISGTDISGTNYLASYKFINGISASLVGYSVEHDLAVLRVSTDSVLACNKDACAIEFAEDYSLLEEAYAIGNPHGNGISVTNGIVSVYSETIYIDNMPADGKSHNYRVMRVNNNIYEGNSGGGLFNSKGKLIGIINAGALEPISDNLTSSYENYSYALPVDQVLPCIENLMYYGGDEPVYSVKAVSTSQLGASFTNSEPDFNESNGRISYKVSATIVNSSSALYRAGLRKGDVVKSFKVGEKTKTITWAHQLEDMLLNIRPTSDVVLKVERAGVLVDIDITDYIRSLFK